MKIRNIRLIGAGLFLLVIVSLYVYAKVPRVENEVDKSFSQEQIEVTLKEIEVLQDSLSKEGGFYKQVEEKLNEMGYEYLMLGMFYSKDEILIKFVLTNKDANEQEKVEVKEVFDELAIKNKLNPKIFKVKVSNDDSSEW